MQYGLRNICKFGDSEHRFSPIVLEMFGRGCHPCDRMVLIVDVGSTFFYLTNVSPLKRVILQK